MSTVAEIKNAIDRLSPDQRRELEQLVWPEWDQPGEFTGDPPRLIEKLKEAINGRFLPGDPKTASRIISGLK